MRRRRLRTVGFETTPDRVSRRAILCAKLPAAERAEGSTPSPKHLTSIPFSAFQPVSLATSRSRPSYLREISSALGIFFAAVPLASCSSSAGIRGTAGTRGKLVIKCSRIHHVHTSPFLRRQSQSLQQVGPSTPYTITQSSFCRLRSRVAWEGTCNEQRQHMYPLG